MVIHTADDKAKTLSLNIGTGTKLNSGKEYIYCELYYHNKKSGKSYDKVFPATKFDEVSRLFYTLYNNAIPAADIPGLFK
jgi:hypothetical protein